MCFNSFEVRQCNRGYGICGMARDLTQREMAEILSVAQTTYSDYENDKINIPIETLKKLAYFFDTSIDYLLKVTDNPAPDERKK